MTPPDSPAAILWDMDGTLIDTEPFWIEAEMSLAARFGVTWTHDDGLSLVGNALDSSAQVLISRGIPLPEAEIIDYLVTSVASRAADAMPWMDDARVLLNASAAHGIPCALVTMSIGALVERFLEEAGDVFGAVVTGDQVTRGKPDPEAYLLAARRLGVDAKDCVAIEDSPVGVRAALESGAVTIAVRANAGVSPAPGLTQLPTLDGLTVASLGQLMIQESERRAASERR